MKASRAYGDIKIYSPCGVMMFRTNEKRLNFYLKNDLVCLRSCGGFQLKFKPGGLGHAERNKDLLYKRFNKCVCCGTDELEKLTRHHVIPRRFRIHFPQNLKGNNHRFVLLLCRTCHDIYCLHEIEFNNILSIELNLPSIKDFYYKHSVKLKVLKGLNNVLFYDNKIPELRKIELKNNFKKETGLEPTYENLVKELCKHSIDSWGKAVVDKVSNLYEFQNQWLNHFITKMNPKYLPEDLNSIINIY